MSEVLVTKPIIEQHFHGAYGIDFNKASAGEVLDLAMDIKKEGVGGIFPTLVTDSVENINRQIKVIKEAHQRQKSGAKILGIHLEGIFLNPQKKGIHNCKYFLEPVIDNFKLVEDDFIKIVTIAPELCTDNMIEYLSSKGIKVQAGHCVGGELKGIDGVTHIFNAMSGINHREQSTTLSALTDDNIYTEVIADGIHINDNALKLVLKAKPADKIILISDSLPCTHSNLREFIFADEKIYYDGEKATSEQGTLAGSTKLLPEIIKIIGKKGIFNPQYIENPYLYHKIDLDGKLVWDKDFNITSVS